MPMKVLIVGSKGQLGRTLCFTAPNEVTFLPLDLPEFDITDARVVDQVVGNAQPDVIINASAYTAVDRAEEETDLAYRVNAVGPKHLALAARKNDARMIHISTDYVFDGTASTPYRPDSPCSPLGVYGKSKLQGEINVQDHHNDWVIIRTSWLYSEHGNNFVLTMLRLMNEMDKLTVVADQIGAPTWAVTLAESIWSVVDKPKLKGIFHWSDAGVASWYDFALAIQEEALALGLLNRAVSIIPTSTVDYPTPAKRPAYSLLYVTNNLHEFGTVRLHWRVALRHMLGAMQDGKRNI